MSKLSFFQAELDFSNIDNSDLIIPDNVDVYNLFPTYRKIIGKPLSYQTKKSLYYVAPDRSCITSNIEPGITTCPPTPLELWNKERESIDPNTKYTSYETCLDSTYNTAALVLKDRKTVYSKSDILEWVHNQDKVFELCIKALHSDEIVTRETKTGWFSSFINYFKSKITGLLSIFRKEKTVIVTKPKCITDGCIFETKYKGKLQQDYEYQQAAMSFYNSDYDLASKQFKVISETKDHPWQTYATYSLGRVYLQLGEDLNKKEEYDKKAVEQFQNLIIKNDYKILSSDELTMLRINAQNTLDHMTYKNDEKILETTNRPEIIKIVLDELYTSNTYGKASKQSSYAQWSRAWTSTTTDSLAVSVAKDNYKKTKQALWLVPIVRHIKVSDPMFLEVSSAIRNLPESFPAYWTVQYYLIKSYVDAGDIKTATELLSGLPRTPSPWVWNYIEDLGMATSNNLVDMFKHSVRYSITTDYILEDRDTKKIRQIQMIDDKAKDVFSLIPIEKQAEIFTANDVLSKNQTELVRLTIFARAILQKNFDIADKMAVLISKNNKEIGIDLSKYLNAKTMEEKGFTSAVFMLTYPGVGLWLYDDAVVKVPMVVKSTNNIYDDNLMNSYKTISDYSYHRWDYCQPYTYTEDNPNDINSSGQYKDIDIPEPKHDISFVTRVISKQDQSLARNESKKLYVIPPNYFAEIILAYAKAHPKDTRIPETLHLAVKITKYSTCANNKTSGYSKRMYKLLHSKYPNSQWTKQTPLYY